MSQASCEKTFSIEVTGNCIDWNAVVWDVVEVTILEDGGPGVLTALAGEVYFRLTSSGLLLLANSTGLLHGSVLYTGTGCTFRIVIDVIEFARGAVFFFAVKQDGATIFLRESTTFNSLTPGLVLGVNTFDIPVAAGVNSVIEILGTRFPDFHMASAVRFIAATAVIEMRITFSNP